MSPGAGRGAGADAGGARPAEVIIGLDVGTTGVKAVAFGVGSAWRTLALREYPLLQPAGDEQVHTPTSGEESTCEKTTRVLPAASILRKERRCNLECVGS